ncbi:bactofilin family protein [Morganella psychrotolerans]|uniref:bactofilin family protein n=1 Tax=Morganella psychrotolerans TaxID=368603 RepID=UPI0039AEA4C4
MALFKKNNEITQEDKTTKTDAVNKENVINTADKIVKKLTIIGADCVIQGDIKLDGNIEVYGQIKGNVTSGTFKVSVMDNGSIEGDVIAEHVSINGRLAGVCHARNIEILQKGVLNGVCRAEVFSINTGGVFIGQSEPYIKKATELNKEKKSHQDINSSGENNEVKIIKK